MRVCLALLCNDTPPFLEVAQKNSENRLNGGRLVCCANKKPGDVPGF
jgi:hypothetical protein